MDIFEITGGKKLSGEIRVQGSKNVLFPLLAATLLTDQECSFTNVPEITDKEVMVKLLTDLGVEVEAAPHSLKVRATHLMTHELSAEYSSQLRGSIVLLGGLLGRLKKASMTFPGGDMIGQRPIDAHLSAFEKLGAKISVDNTIEIRAEKLIGNTLVLEESSVTATENIILASVLAQGKTIIKLAATEPHVQQLCEFLNLMGAKISGIGTPTITIEGVASLRGASIELIPDSNEAASFITLAAATKSEVMVTGINPEYMDDFFLKLRNMNVQFEIGDDFVQVKTPVGEYSATKIQCGLYPKLASDDIPPMAVLATQAEGKSKMNEWMYENRLGYVSELVRMGASAETVDSHNVIFTGPTNLHGEKITSLDIRMGMTLVVAALVAEGQSTIEGVEHIDRGYEKIEERLQKIGADIKRVTVTL